MAKKKPKFERSREIYNLTITLPEPPPLEEIDGYGLPEKDQKFRVRPLPKGFYQWDDEAQERFEDEEWEKRKDGYWFMNNGNIEYITGVHYMYINWWKIDIGLPMFIDADRDYFYFWEHCVHDEFSYGMIDIENRRGGKTYRAGCIMYEKISRTKDAVGGIQSKTGPDAKKVFKKAIISPWKKLPQFFKPEDVGSNHPSSVLEFREPTKIDKKGNRKQYDDVLDSEIGYAPSQEEAYDGAKLIVYLGDEIGKTVESNVYERWQIVKECLVDGADIVGKALLTTTVEEMEKKGGKNCYEIWKRSDPENRNDLGETESGLYRYFKPAYYGFRGKDRKTGKRFIDDYGYSDQKGAKEYFEKRRAGLTGAALSSEKRKYPFTAEEAFRMDNKDSPFDLDRIYVQKEHNYGLPNNTVVRGNFVWVVKDHQAKFQYDPSGRWQVAWMPNEDGSDNEKRNNYLYRGGTRFPGNAQWICAGVDPYDHKKTTDGRKSYASCHVRRKHDPLNPNDTKCFVAHYLSRPPDPEIFYEDMIIAAFYYGYELLAESNRPGLINYFRTRGYGRYLMKRPDPTHTAYSRKNQTEPGIPMSGDSARNALIGAIETEVYNNCGYLEEEGRYAFNPFQDTLDDWIDFDVENWTPYDSTVSSGLALLAERKFVVQKEQKAIKIGDVARYYDNRGLRSVRKK